MNRNILQPRSWPRKQKPIHQPGSTGPVLWILWFCTDNNTQAEMSLRVGEACQQRLLVTYVLALLFWCWQWCQEWCTCILERYNTTHVWPLQGWKIRRAEGGEPELQDVLSNLGIYPYMYLVNSVHCFFPGLLHSWLWLMLWLTM